MEARKISNYVNGEWVASEASEHLNVVNPATLETLAQVPLSTPEEVQAAVRAAKEAFWDWRSTPPPTRARYTFRLKDLMEENFEELSRLVTCRTQTNRRGRWGVWRASPGQT